MLVGVGDATIILFPEFVLRTAGMGIAAFPKIRNKRIALLVRGELLERLPLSIRDDVGNFLDQPFNIRRELADVGNCLVKSCLVRKGLGTVFDARRERVLTFEW